jgi:hypothetical protein
MAVQFHERPILGFGDLIFYVNGGFTAMKKSEIALNHLESLTIGIIPFALLPCLKPCSGWMTI